MDALKPAEKEFFKKITTINLAPESLTQEDWNAFNSLWPSMFYATIDDKKNESNKEYFIQIETLFLIKYLDAYKQGKQGKKKTKGIKRLKTNIITVGKKIFKLENKKINSESFSIIFNNAKNIAINPPKPEVGYSEQGVNIIINDFKNKISKETWQEKLKNRWQWIVGLGILGLGIFSGYQYYQFKQKK